MSDADSGATSGRQFHLRQLVGKGAFGEVYLADQDSGAGFRRKVAIKLLHTDVAAMSRDAGRRMRDEARILGRLSHRNIVTVLDLIKLGDRWAIIMDYVPGADLEETLQALHAAGLAFPGAAAIEVGASVLDALDAAFRSTDDEGRQLGVIHRDIKPSNIRLTTDGEVKVLDFGVARVNLDTREAQTRATGWIGTERYMAPERILCEGDGPAGDVYAAVASIVELLQGEPLGRTPVLEDRHTPWVEEALARCRAALAGPEPVVDELVDWLRRGLHALPERRPSAREMSDALGRLARQLEGDGVVAFARGFMPRVDQILQRAPEAATGVLAEHSSGSGIGLPTSPTLAPVPDSATYVAGGADEAPPPGTDRSVRIAAVLGLVVIVALLSGLGAIGLGYVAYTRSQREAEPELAVAPTPAPAPVTPAPAPVAAPVPPPEPAPEAAPAPAPEPAPARPSPVPSAPRPAPAPAPAGPRVDRAMVVLKDASSLTVTCGDTRATGTASARISNFPAGSCAISAVYLDQTYTSTAAIDRPREVQCTVTGGSLTCE